MTTPRVCLIYVTAPDAATAERIGRALVEEGMAACVNILPGMTSIYRWQGAVETAAEVVLIVKCAAAAAAAVTARITALHPYECPSVLVLPVDGGNPAFLAWVAIGSQ